MKPGVFLPSLATTSPIQHHRLISPKVSPCGNRKKEEKSPVPEQLEKERGGFKKEENTSWVGYWNGISLTKQILTGNQDLNSEHQNKFHG